MLNIILIIILFICSISDIKNRKVSNLWILAGLIMGPLIYIITGRDFWEFIYNLIGAIIITVIMILAAVVCENIFQKQVMGGADIKLIFMCGLYLALDRLLYVIFIALMGVVFAGLIMKLKKRNHVRFPFVPFLFISVILVLLPATIKGNYLPCQIVGSF